MVSVLVRFGVSQCATESITKRVPLGGQPEAGNGVLTFEPARHVPSSPADESSAAFSPDRKWIAYSSDESGRRDVYVRGFAPDRNPAAAVGQSTISVAGGDEPRWSRDGKELFYIAPDGTMMAVPIKGGPAFEPGVPLRCGDPPRPANDGGRIEAAERREH